MSSVVLLSKKGVLICKPFSVNSDCDCVIEENDLPIPIEDDAEQDCEQS